MKQIPLTQGKFAMVDDEDYEWLSKWKWCYQKTKKDGYAIRGGIRNGKQYTIAIHRVILNPNIGEDIDHINRNRLDNRRENLRICTRKENTRNRGLDRDSMSGFKGVYWHKRVKKWCAHIKVNYKDISLGYFIEKVDAAKAYNTGALKYFGKFSWLNSF